MVRELAGCSAFEARSLEFTFWNFTLLRFHLPPVLAGTERRMSLGRVTATSDPITYLHQRFCSFQEMLLAMRLGSLLVPIDNGLLGDTVFVVQRLRFPNFNDPRNRQDS